MNTKLRMRLVFTVTFFVALAATVAAMALTAHYTEYKAETTATYENELSALAAANGGVKQLSSNSQNTLVLFNNGSVYGCGYHFAFGVDDNSYVETPTFEKITDMTNVTSISAGVADTMVIADGNLYVAGGNYNGELGLGMSKWVSTYTQVNGLSNITKAVMGVNGYFSMVICDGNLYVAGDNSYGQLGLGDEAQSIETFTKVPGLTNVTDVAGGSNYSLVVAGGKLYAAGRGPALGLGGSDTIRTYTEVLGFANIKSVSCGYNNSAIITSDGKLYVAGANKSGTLGLASIAANTPVDRFTLVEKFDSVNSISFSEDNTAVLADGGLYFVGKNGGGVCGQAESSQPLSEFTDSGIKNVAALSFGYNFTFIVNSNGVLYGTGSSLNLGLNKQKGFIYGFTEIPFYYTVKYVSNDGNGDFVDQKVDLETTVTIQQPTFQASGLRFVGWSTTSDGAKEYDAGQTVDAMSALPLSTITLYAVWVLESVIPEIIGETRVIYGTDIALTALVSKVYGYTYKYEWYKNEDTQAVGTEETLTLTAPNVADSGTSYTVKVTASKGSEVVSGTSAAKQITVNPITVEVIWYELVTEFTYNGTVQGPMYALINSHGFSEMLTVTGRQTNAGDHEVTAHAPENFHENYVLGNATIKYTIKKADYTNKQHRSLTCTYDPTKTLADYALDKFYSWNDTTIVPVAATRKYAAKYNADPANYNDYALTVTLTVNKATVTPPTIVSKEYTGEKLTADVTDADIYTVKTNEGGTNAGSYDVVLSLKDSSNYQWTSGSSSDLTLAFKITPLPNEWTTELSMNGWTYGETYNVPAAAAKYGEVVFTYSDSQTGVFTAMQPTNAGDYYVRATVTETNYAGLTATLGFTIAKADITPVVTLDGWTYGATANEPSVSGNTGSGAVTYEYSADGETFGAVIPTNAGTYYVRATIAATDNYNGATSAAATFTVAKADTVINVDGVETEYTYDGTEQSVNSGAKHDRGDGTELTYTNNTFTTVAEGDGLVVTISIAESANYNAASATVTLKVHKAKVEAPVIAVKEYTGETLTAEVGDTELYTVAKNEGGKDNGLYDVELALTDPANYEWSAKEGATIAGATITLEFAVVKTANKWTGEPKIAGIKYGETLVPEYAAQHGNETVVIEYKAKGGDAYSTEKPTEVGEYVARFTIAANSNYDGLEAEVTFAIVKADLTITVTLDGWTYGATANDPIVNGNTGNGAVTYEYSTDGGTYSTAKPTNAGTYYVRVTVAATDNYNGATSEAVSFTIAKANYTNVAYNSELTGTYDPEKTLADYALDANYAWADATVIPTVAVTTYAAKYNADPDNYNDFDLTITLTISKADITVTVTLDGWTYGATANDASVSGNIDDGEVTYEYSTDGETYSTAKPTNAGTYYVRVSIAATDNYNGATSEAVTFTIAKADITVTVTLNGWTYGATANDASVSGNTDDGEVTYGYSADGETYSAAKPTNAGTYYVRVSIAATDNYNGATSEAVTFTIKKADITPIVTLNGWTYGATSNDASINGNTDDGEVAYGYSADGETYSTAKPTNAGTYYVRATVAATDNYNGATSEAVTFTIKKAVYDMSGVKFENKTVEANGNAQIITIGGTLPDGVTVTYNGSGTEAGTYTITAKFGGDTANYEAIADMTATLTINAVAEKGGCGSVVTDGVTIAVISIAALLLACAIMMRKTRKDKK